MILRPKPGAQPKPRLDDHDEPAATGPRAPSGTQGWKVAGSPGSTTTLWRRRGRLATVSGGLRRAQ